MIKFVKSYKKFLLGFFFVYKIAVFLKKEVVGFYEIWEEFVFSVLSENFKEVFLVVEHFVFKR